VPRTLDIKHRKWIRQSEGQAPGLSHALIHIPHNTYHPFVVCMVSDESLAHGEWMWGSYHTSLESATADFAGRDV